MKHQTNRIRRNATTKTAPVQPTSGQKYTPVGHAKTKRNKRDFENVFLRLKVKRCFLKNLATAAAICDISVACFANCALYAAIDEITVLMGHNPKAFTFFPSNNKVKFLRQASRLLRASHFRLRMYAPPERN
jgi:hypothetical protein